jgi:Tol biopolymer transport system component
VSADAFGQSGGLFLFGGGTLNLFMPTKNKIEFSHFSFDWQDQRLLGPSGEIPLAVKSAAVLAYLLQRPNQIIPKDELLHAVWADTAVTDDALVQRVLDIRKALGDNSRTPRFIRTHPKRGYEFVGGGTVDTVDEPEILIQSLTEPRASTLWDRRWPALLVLAGVSILIACIILFVRYGSFVNQLPDLQISQLTFRAQMDDYPSVDPSGHRILYTSDEAGAANLWILDETNGERRQITHSEANLSEPDLSSDADWVAYRSEEGNGGLYARSLTTGVTMPIATFGHHPRWSPDGRRVAFQSAGSASSIYIWSREDGSTRKLNVQSSRLTDISWPVWGRDGKVLYFIASVRFDYETEQKKFPDWVQLGHQIWCVSAAGGNPTVTTPGTGIVKDGGFDYDRERSELVFVGLDRGLWRSKVDPKTGTEKGKPIRLTLTTQGHQHPRIGADGEIVFSAITGQEALWLVPFKEDGVLDEGAMSRLTTGAASVRDPTLSPDGRHIAYFIWSGNRFELWLLDLATHVARPIGPSDRFSRTSPIWSDDGLALTYTVFGGRNRELRHAWFTQDFSKLTDEQKPEKNFTLHRDRGWHPSGKFHLEIRTQDDHQEIWLDRKGGAASRLTPPGHYMWPSWSLDGKRIFFQSDEGGWFNIWWIDFDPVQGVPISTPQQSSSFRGSPYLLSDINLGFAVQPRGLVVPLRENRSDLWMIRGH